MLKKMRDLALIIVALMWVLPSQAQAWSKFGHVLVCEIAYRQLTDDARDKLNTLIENQSFEDEHGDPLYPSFNHGCLREDQVRQRPSEHYINYPRDWSRVDNAQCPGGRDCLLSAIELDAERLGDTSLPNDERLAAALALGHWIGDIHQPMHVSF